MLGVARLDDRGFVAAMQAINATVRNAAFAASFFGAPLLTTVVAVLAHARRSPVRWWVTAGAVLYAGAFAVTMGISVPLNEALAAVGPAALVADPAAVRAGYEGPWVGWNLVRTVLGTAALAALVRATLLSRTDR